MNSQQSVQKQIGIYVVDGEDLLRTGLCLLLNEDERITVLGSSESLDTALPEIERLAPQVVIVKGLANAEHLVQPIARLHRQCPDVLVLVLMELISPEVVGALVSNMNVYGIYSARADIQAIVNGIRAITGGSMCFDTRISHVVRDMAAKTAVSGARPQQRINSLASSLTGREGEILRCVARGMTNQQIAQELHISVETVKTYIRRIMDKSAIRSRNQLLNCLFDRQSNSDVR